MEIICNECGLKSNVTWHLNQKGGLTGETVPDICDECMKLGWQEATVEDVEELNLELVRRQIYKQQSERNL